MMRQDRFTEGAQEVLAASQELVRKERHSQWDVEHVLLAMLTHERGILPAVFEKLNVDVPRLKNAVETALAKSPKLQYDVVQIYTTPRIVRMLEAANAEAERLQDEYVGVEHILIAMADEREGESARILKQFGIDKETYLPGAAGGARRRASGQPDGGDEVQGARQVQHRPDGGRAAGQARPGDRPRGRDQARDADPEPAHEEQPGDHRRGRRRQDGDRRRAGAEDRLPATCRRT